MAIGLVLFVCFYDSRMTSQSFEAAVTKLGTLVRGCNFGSRRSKVEVAGVKKHVGVGSGVSVLCLIMICSQTEIAAVQ